MPLGQQFFRLARRPAEQARQYLLGWSAHGDAALVQRHDIVAGAQENRRVGDDNDGMIARQLTQRVTQRDFRLHVEFWPGAESNSGIFIRCEDPAAVSAISCYEINIFDTNENPDNRTGSIVNHAPPLTTTEAEEQWNTYDIVAEGSRIVVTLNGNVTAEIDDDSHANGPFALQNNGGLIRFRNVRLQPL